MTTTADAAQKKEKDLELSPFQQTAISADGHRIILQDRRTGSSMMQAFLAAYEAKNDGRGVLAVHPEKTNAFWDHLPNAVRTSQAGTYDRFGESEARIDNMPVRSIWREPDSMRGHRNSLIIFDQPQMVRAEMFETVAQPNLQTDPDVAVVLAATGNNTFSGTNGPSVLERAMETGEFDLVWCDYIDGIGGGHHYNYSVDLSGIEHDKRAREKRKELVENAP